jgi:hypothetical protein
MSQRLMSEESEYFEDDADYQDWAYGRDQGDEWDALQYLIDREQEKFIEGKITKEELFNFLMSWLHDDNLMVLEYIKRAENAKKEKIQAELPSPGLDGC